MRIVDRLLTLGAILAIPVMLLGAVKGGVQGLNAFKSWRLSRARADLADSLIRNNRGALLLGPDSAPTYIEFVDYQCPACRAVDSVLRGTPSLANALRLRVLQYPLTNIHPQAYLASRAAVCAESGGFFARFHHKLYANGLPTALPGYWEVAKSVGASDSAGFVACIESTESDREVERQVELGRRFGVRGTPTFVSQKGESSGLSALLELSDAGKK